MQRIDCKSFIKNADATYPKCGLNTECYVDSLCFTVYAAISGKRMLEDESFSFSPIANSLKLKILYDDEALNGFREAFGFSCLIEEKGILFDAGGDVDTLLFNMQKFRIDPLSSIRIIVLSHEHIDHTGGIQIINYCGKVDVFVPASFSDRFKGWLASHPNVRLYEVQELEEVCEGVFTTGELGQFVKEQSLIVKTGNGLTVITGCAHPGLENVLRAASKLGDIYGVVGGFHDFSRLEALKGMHLIVPCHCTVRKRGIFNLYPKTCKKCSAGCTILI
jgi:7,8-dihydropterin-6-yl-methyl-4-(beta-D-ribofuranosyl)aminobenzene 5'-phosphate synthase